MRSVQLSAVGHVHGSPCPVAELTERSAAELAPLVAEIESYRASPSDIWELGVTAAERSLELAAAAPDLLLYVTENDPDTTASLARIADRLDLPAVERVALSGHDCGNLGPALRVASDLLWSRRCARILLVLADRALAGRRVMANGMSVFSDGAAACVITRQPEGNGPRFVLHAVATRSRAGSSSDVDDTVLGTVALARDSVAAVLTDCGHDKSAFHHVVFGNYRPTSQRFLAAAMGLPATKLLVGPVTEFGHCFAADLLVTLDVYRSRQHLAPGDLVLAAVTGPYSWSTMALECA